MDHLTHEHLLATLEKLESVLIAEGFSKGSVQIGFNPKTLDEQLSQLRDQPPGLVAPIKTARLECHFGGCGIVCCTF